jgi:CBS domain-containing protein
VVAALGDLTTDSSIGETATFGDAVEALAESDAAVLAVVDADERVVGLLDERRLLRGLFPAYLGELTHTAFAEDDPASIAERRSEAASEPITKFMAEPTTVDADASLTHVAERLMHCALEGVAVVDDGRYRGVVDLHRFVQSILRA